MGKIVLLNLSPEKKRLFCADPLFLELHLQDRTTQDMGAECFVINIAAHTEQNRRTGSGLNMSYSVIFTETTFYPEVPLGDK